MSQEPVHLPPPPSRAGLTQGLTLAAVVLLSTAIAGVALLGMLGSAIIAINGSGPRSDASDGWTPAREWFLLFPVLGSPLVAIAAIVGAICTRRNRGWWALWFVAGFVLVILFIEIGVHAMRGAPPWE